LAETAHYTKTKKLFNF